MTAYYDARRWYWIVGNRSGVVYSSESMAYVADTDAAYQAWLADENMASNILTDGELADVLTRAGLDGPVVLSADPTDWGAVDPFSIVATAKAAGCVITSSTIPALNAHYQVGAPGMEAAQTYINASGQLPNVNQPMPWPAYDKLVTFNTAGDFEQVYQGIQDYWTAWRTWAQTGGTAPPWGGWDVATRSGRHVTSV